MSGKLACSILNACKNPYIVFILSNLQQTGYLELGGVASSCQKFSGNKSLHSMPETEITWTWECRDRDSGIDSSAVLHESNYGHKASMFMLIEHEGVERTAVFEAYP